MKGRIMTRHEVLLRQLQNYAERDARLTKRALAQYKGAIAADRELDRHAEELPALVHEALLVGMKPIEIGLLAEGRAR
jgi:hypothetical protein